MLPSRVVRSQARFAIGGPEDYNGNDRLSKYTKPSIPLLILLSLRVVDTFDCVHGQLEHTLPGDWISSKNLDRVHEIPLAVPNHCVAGRWASELHRSGIASADDHATAPPAGREILWFELILADELQQEIVVLANVASRIGTTITILRPQCRQDSLIVVVTGKGFERTDRNGFGVLLAVIAPENMAAIKEREHTRHVCRALADLVVLEVGRQQAAISMPLEPVGALLVREHIHVPLELAYERVDERLGSERHERGRHSSDEHTA